MSAANAAMPASITLDELEGLIKRLGMLGSTHDGEVLVAARFVMRWLEQHQTDWRSLLTPEEEVGVSGVVAAQDEVGRLQSELDAAYQRGRSDGMAQMTAQLKAQAAYAGLGSALGAGQQWTGGNVFAAGLGGGLGGAGLANAAQQPLNPGAAQAPPGGLGGGSWATTGLGQPNPHPAGSWQAVAWELLDRHASGIPGVFRGSREETFVRDVLARGFRSLTTAQETWLRDIAGRSGMSW